MIDWLFSWLLEKLLNYFLGKVTVAIEDHVQQMAEDKRRGEVNDKNVKAYEEAVDRRSRINAALALLNRAP